MASSRDYLDYVLELLSGVDGLTTRKMMGEYLLYSDGILFGGIYDNRLLIKYPCFFSSAEVNRGSL
ncbi:TfoX/Sxy family protein [Collinsella tanakaei]|mgnify:CR=1 FL=1|uniref:TfoX/Sxy family protein n=1 Tax=Collinsella tanakaei TaxID=626935 RepID=UPI00265891F1|nr:TfoX/Sxy family protein [Collinsella tanakaei]